MTLRFLAFAALAAVCSGAPAHALPGRNLPLKSWRNDYAPPPGGTNYSSCWSYVHKDGREYAVIGVNGLTATTGGTAIYNVTDPTNAVLVGFIQGPQSIWREMKSYRDWIYVVTEGFSGPNLGLQIIRMTNPDAPVLAATYTTNFYTAHTVSVDTTRGILICNGTRATGSNVDAGMRFLALRNTLAPGASPETPVEIGWWPGGSLPAPGATYVHDSVPIGNRLYLSCIQGRTARVLDFTNPAAPTQLASWTYPGAFTHNSWPDATGNWLYATDETKGEPLKVFDISNLGSPTLVNGITSNPQAIVHNAHVKGNELFLANYTEGVRVLDVSDPAHPAEFAWADSYGGLSGGFGGAWGISPYFPSGTVIASDRNTGLYVYRVERDYGIVRVRVVDATSQLPLAGAEVHLTSQGDSLETPADGIVQFAPSPGTHTVLAHAFGWTEASVTLPVTAGSRDTVTLALQLRPVATFAGIVRDKATQAPLDASEVTLRYTPLHEHTEADGEFSMEVPEDDYEVQVRHAGYEPLVYTRHLGPNLPPFDYALAPAALWDELQINSGWTAGAPGDNATGGLWTLAAPLGTGPRPPADEANGAARVWTHSRLGLAHEEEEPAHPNLAPYFDHTPGAGTQCFVTGQGTDTLSLDQADVDNGRTTLTSRVLNATGMADPVVGYWRWFGSYFTTSASSGNNGPEPQDFLAVLISNDNGVNWFPVDTTRGLENHWEEQTIHIAEHVSPTAQVRLRFVAMDGGPATYVEAAIDDLILYDAAPEVTGVVPAGSGRLAFRAPSPNPARGAVRLTVDLPVAAEVTVEVLDLQGRRVRLLREGNAAAGPVTTSWDGRDGAGRLAPAGLYFARAIAGGAVTVTRFARL